MLFIAPLFLVMTEVQGVKITRLIGRAQASTLSNIPSAVVDPALDGFMVHTTGPLSVSEDASGAYTDKDTGVCFGSGAMASAQVNTANFAFQLRAGAGATQPLVPSNPMRIERTVEVYQWVEREEQDAQSTACTLPLARPVAPPPTTHRGPHRRRPFALTRRARAKPLTAARAHSTGPSPALCLSHAQTSTRRSGSRWTCRPAASRWAATSTRRA